MSNFLKFVIFVCVIILLPVILNIFDNLIKIFNLLKNKDYVCNKILEFSEREFRDFVLEFSERSHKYRIYFKKDDIYLNDGDIERLLYYDNENCEKFTIYDARNVIGICESKGKKNLFIFTTKVLDNVVLDYFRDIEDKYNIKYIHGNDLNLDYEEFICKFYTV